MLKWRGSFAGVVVLAAQRKLASALWMCYLLHSQKLNVLWSDFCGFNGIPLVFD